MAGQLGPRALAVVVALASVRRTQAERNEQSERGDLLLTSAHSSVRLMSA